ncbi:helix-turn-helix domain-containing protein [Limnohabitans sp. T6-5]|uniref:helix-turn-helix domain-containing protein n=1 Tax=Limnohabitans sp. T6-5 TaxID=1100724 RepID=UPI001E4172CC|nr:helix-turn-helix domain-containing protein [Limnohabitans sp. T6-5]
MLESARRNRILAALPLSQYTRMVEHLKPVDLVSGQVIYEPGEALDFVYFPITCTTSLVSHTQDGESSELAMTGRDGLVGIPLVLGGASMNHRVMVQRAGCAFRMSAEAFEAELLHSRALQQLSLSYVQTLITQISQSIVCIGHHAVSERLCYWLLFNSDQLLHDPIKITHEMIAHMLGVRRESVTQALGKLQASGLVASGRGKITVLDREGLTQQVCECFSLVTSETQRLHERALRACGTDEAHTPMADEAQSAPDLSLLQKYQDAYDFAPVGFVSLDRQCQVVQTNLTGAIMLGIQRSNGYHHSFLEFIPTDDQSRFRDFHQAVLSGKCRHHLEITLSGTEHRAEMMVRIDGTLDESGEECSLVMIDVTEERKQLTQLLARERQQQDFVLKQPAMQALKDSGSRQISAPSTPTGNACSASGQPGLDKFDCQAVYRDVPQQESLRPSSGSSEFWFM